MRFVMALILAVTAQVACAQKRDNDYYLARGDKDLGALLATVEKYHLQKGLDAVRSKHYLYAHGDLNFILNYFPNHPTALLAMGDLCEAWRDSRCNIEAYFEKALQISPNNERLHLTRGIYLQKRGRLDSAVESYKKALELDPTSANAHYNLGLALVAQKKFDLANQHAQEAYSRGITLPGLQEKLIAAKAWKPVPPASVREKVGSAPASNNPFETQPTVSPPVQSDHQPIGGTPN